MDVSDQLHVTADLSSGTITMTVIIIIIIIIRYLEHLTYYGNYCGLKLEA
jgi:hypothetical protein